MMTTTTNNSDEMSRIGRRFHIVILLADEAYRHCTTQPTILIETAYNEKVLKTVKVSR
jgi:hypothetical protein